MRRFLHYCLNRTPVVGLLMAALLFRALIPAGLMPTRADDGTIAMELCSGFTTKRVEVKTDEGDSGQSPDHAGLFDHSPCSFAVSLSAPPPAPFSFAPPTSLPAMLFASDSASVIAPTIRRAQAPRGPPSL